MFRNFDIDALRAVVASADFGSFARAATQLNRSQSAISMQLKKLERQAGTQLFVRKGRTLAPTEAGETLIAYARRIVALNDETAIAVGAAVNTANVHLGLPQDFFDDVLPATLKAFSHVHPHAHVNIRVGENHKLSEEIQAGRLDVAIAFVEAGGKSDGDLIATLPMHWLAYKGYHPPNPGEDLPLVMFDHPCLYRKAALFALDQAKMRWRMAVTTPSLLYIWSALRSADAVAVRNNHGLPDDIVCLDAARYGLPELPAIELRLLLSHKASSTAHDLCTLLRQETANCLNPVPSTPLLVHKA